MSRTKQAIVTDLDEPLEEDVLEEAPDELLGGDGATLELVSGRLFVGKGDLAIMEVVKPVVTEGHAKDVRGEILESLQPTAHGFRVPQVRSDLRQRLAPQLFSFRGPVALG
jgi:hypothetical protein